MGILDIHEDDDLGEMPEGPLPYTITVATIWLHEQTQQSVVRFATGVFVGTHLGEIAARAIQHAVNALAADDGFLCESADVVSFILGSHENLAPEVNADEDFAHPEPVIVSGD